MSRPQIRTALLYDISRSLGLTAALCVTASPVFAASPEFRIETGPSVLPPTDFGKKPELAKDQPVLLEAEQLDYQSGGLVIASGRVAITQGDTILIADQLAYDQTGDIVIAQGNVSLLESTGNVYFADEVELKSDLKAGVVKQFKMRMHDDSLMAAARANRISETRTDLFKAIYSPCKCENDTDGKPKNPQWAIRADRAVIDEEEQKITYDNVSFDVYGLPVFYSPYLSHMMPGAENQSGILMPEYQHTEGLGSMFKVPVYYAIAQDKDMTLTPIYTSEEGLVMGGEYRQKFNSGELHFDGSFTRASRRNATGQPVNGHEMRGNLNAEGRFIINPNYDWGFDIRRTTDDTYLRKYRISDDTLLTSRAYVQGFNFPGTNDRSYGSLSALAFQGLTAQDNRARIPSALPLGEFSYQSDPGLYRSRFTVDANMLALDRDIGSRSRRLSNTFGWKLPYITDDGQVIEFRTQLRSDIYSVQDRLLGDGRNFSGTTGRVVPQVDMLWHYPFINRGENSSLLIEPVVMMALSPGGGNPEKIPNEDSVAPEFTDTNLFDANRFAGYDRIESGPRMSYGMRGQAQFYGNKYLDWMLGQNYRVNNDRTFPFTNDLDSRFSDYVGKVGVTYDPLSIAYRFRLDKDGLSPKRQEVEFGYSMRPVSMAVSLLELKDDPILANKQVANASGTINLTREWSWIFGGSQDLQEGLVTSAATGLVYQNECTAITGTIGRDYTRDRDIEPGTTFLFKISLKNLD